MNSNLEAEYGLLLIVFQVGDLVYVAGQIALVPGTMKLVEGGVRKECRLALRHVSRIARAMDPNAQLRDVVQVRKNGRSESARAVRLCSFLFHLCRECAM